MGDRPAPVRVGVRRPSSASADPAIALAEARIIRHELRRRLGDVDLDLRTEGSPLGPWEPIGHAAWPGDVDATLDLDHVTGRESPRLLALFGRTVDPMAADVRRRMLRHLGALPIDHLDDHELDRRLPHPRRPTDLWLAVTAAASLDVSDARLHAFIDAGTDEADAVDGWLDEQVSTLEIDRGPIIARLTARVDELQRELSNERSEAARNERLALGRLDDLQAECDVLRERALRSTLDAAGTDPGRS